MRHNAAKSVPVAFARGTAAWDAAVALAGTTIALMVVWAVQQSSLIGVAL